MRKLAPVICFLVVIFLIPACSKSTASTNPDHKVDNNKDIIYGDLSAPHEMVWYFSPGCSHCIRDFESKLPKIKEEYVDPGKLKIVLREVPGITNFTPNNKQRARSIENSFLLAKTFRCEARYNGREAYVTSINNLIKSMREVMPNNFYSWPHIDIPVLEKVFFALGEKNDITIDEYQSCLRGPIEKEFMDAFQKNTDILTKELQNSTLPSYYLNNEKIVGMHRNASPEVFKTLKQVINAEE